LAGGQHERCGRLASSYDAMPWALCPSGFLLVERTWKLVLLPHQIREEVLQIGVAHAGGEAFGHEGDR
jgi:hypothetical protein